ncbi:GNAT family N-acetyltransferase [Ruminococcus sp.]|uniref:GNAT family N-acetyltransferase n=1 Tax=Ruminococcus sp. TaxID=41978 RepID=UPI0025CF6B22|nr:GNAT family N-acetyltransferase [Ruminococcus sp.]MCR4638007.1 GNAT family N-acetyltransferase [Ruminococcus sp.]
MKTIFPDECSRFINCAETIDICRVFPLSVTEKYQSGSIYEAQNCILIRHKNNFTFISGKPDDDELKEIHELILTENLKLMCNDRSLSQKLADMGGVELIPRDIYRYAAKTPPDIHIPEGFCLRNIDSELFDSITGTVAPSLYWDSFEQFSKYGTGVCIMHGNEAASWAFSSAVSRDEADIGIETSKAYQQRGLAYTAAAAVIREILPYRQPTWSCQRSNLGSARTAEKLGFVKYSECLLIRRNCL